MADEEPEDLAPKLVTTTPQDQTITSPRQFMNAKPKKFQVNLGHGIAKFELTLEKDISLTYIAKLYQNGEVKEVDKVEIFFSKKDAKQHAKRFRDIILHDNVIVYSPAFWAKSLREARIMSWSAQALNSFCGFKFF